MWLVVLRQVQINHPRAALLAPAWQGHADFAQAVQARDEVALGRILQEVVLQTVEKMVIGDLQDLRREERQLNKGKLHILLQSNGEIHGEVNRFFSFF